MTKRFAPVAVALAANLLLGLVGGLGRLGVGGGALVARAAEAHGQLMVLGFFGGLVAFEAAAVNRHERGDRVLLLPGIAAAAGLAALIAPELSAVLAVLAACGWGALRVLGARARSSSAVVTALLPAVAWAGGALALAWDGRVATAVPSFAGFLLATILGSRLDTRETEGLSPRATWLPRAALVVLVVLSVAAPWIGALGARARGAAMIVLGAWFLARDVAPAALRERGLSRYTTAARAAAYGWAVAGGVLLVADGALEVGPRFDAAAHAVFLGVAVAMVFAQAPTMLPRLVGRAPAFGRELVIPFFALHAGIALRVCADLGWVGAAAETRRVGGSLSVAAIVLFGAAVARRARGVHPAA